MNVDRAVLAFAGFVVLVSLDLGYYVSPWFFLLVVFAGANVIQGLVHNSAWRRGSSRRSA